MLASQVQSTFVPVPVPLATSTPFWSRTLTVQSTELESRAVKRTGPPRFPATAGSYSFGSPVLATAERMAGSWA